nr:hypothetical protein CFP56_38518 [Quercus suber]
MAGMESNGTLSIEQQQFDPYLCAPPFKTASKNVIHVSGFFEEVSQKSQWRKQGEEDAQITVGANSATVPLVVVSVTVGEVLETSLNKETVTHFNVQRRMGKESVTLENQISTQSTLKNKEVVMPNSGSNDSELHAAAGVIDHTIDDAIPTLEGSDMVNSDDAVFQEQNSVDVVLDMGGGLLMFWRLTIDVIVEGSSTNYFDTMFREEDRAGIGVII